MATDRTRLSQPTRIALLEHFEVRTEAWREDTDEKVDGLVTKLDVLGARVAVYAAVGASVGSIIVGGIAAALVALLT